MVGANESAEGSVRVKMGDSPIDQHSLVYYLETPCVCGDAPPVVHNMC